VLATLPCPVYDHHFTSPVRVSLGDNLIIQYIVVVGAGIGGLAAAYTLTRRALHHAARVSLCTRRRGRRHPRLAERDAARHRNRQCPGTHAAQHSLQSAIEPKCAACAPTCTPDAPSTTCASRRFGLWPSFNPRRSHPDIHILEVQPRIQGFPSTGPTTRSTWATFGALARL
jgi:hypothetical protein